MYIRMIFDATDGEFWSDDGSSSTTLIGHILSDYVPTAADFVWS
jgi:hypothetical protein